MIAIDIGGTFVRYKVNQTTFKVLTKEIELISFLEALIIKYKPIKIAISFAGQVNDNKILSSPNTNFINIDLKKIEKKYNITIILENDLNCAVIAESCYFDEKNIVALYSGTGLGAGIIDNAKLIRGYTNLAGEIGHIPYKNTPFKCKCGKNNCLELFCSGSGIDKWSEFYKKDGLNDNIIKNLYIEALYNAIGIIVVLFNPKILVLGGGVIQNNKKLFNFSKLDKFIANFDKVDIKFTNLENASLKGAEILLKDKK